MVDEKNWWQSRTIWGALVAVLASVLNALDIKLDEGAQGELADTIVQLVGAVGALFAVYGRLNATRVIL